MTIDDRYPSRTLRRFQSLPLESPSGFINIITDASYDPETTTGGWCAFVARHSTDAEIRYGHGTGFINSIDAEAHAIACTLEQVDLARATDVVIRSDCLMALGWAGKLLRARSHTDDGGRSCPIIPEQPAVVSNEVTSRIATARRANRGVRFHVVHVKGHVKRSKQNPIHQANCLADQVAVWIMRGIRDRPRYLHTTT